MNEVSDSTFLTRKWSITSDKTNWEYGVVNEIIHSTEVWKSNLFNFDGACISVKGNLTVPVIVPVVATPVIQVAFKNCSSK